MGSPLNFYSPDIHFEMFANLRSREDSRILQLNKQMLIVPVYIMVGETYGFCPPEAYSLVFNCSAHIIHGTWWKWNLEDFFSLFIAALVTSWTAFCTSACFQYPTHTCHCSECSMWQYVIIIMEKHFCLHVTDRI